MRAVFKFLEEKVSENRFVRPLIFDSTARGHQELDMANKIRITSMRAKFISCYYNNKCHINTYEKSTKSEMTYLLKYKIIKNILESSRDYISFHTLI